MRKERIEKKLLIINNKESMRKALVFTWRIFKHTFKILSITFILLLATLLTEHYFSTDLPTPTGSFSVGRTTLDIKSKFPGDTLSQEVFAWIWYPSSSKTGLREKYLPDEWLLAFNKSIIFIAHFIERDFERVRPHSFHEPNVSPAFARYPIVLFRGGLSTLAPEYTSLCENWASHGYIVIGLDAPFLSRVFVGADNRVVERSNENNPDISGATIENLNEMMPRMAGEWANSAMITLNYLDSLSQISNTNQWSGKLDLNKVAMIGHSLGGAAALQFSIQDARCKAAIDIDGLVTPAVAASGLQKPVLFLIGEHPKSELADPVNRKINEDIQLAIQHTPATLVSRIDLLNANHYNFSDGAVTKNHLLMTLLRLFGIVKMNPVKQLETTGKITLQFLDQKLGTNTTQILATVR